MTNEINTLSVSEKGNYKSITEAYEAGKRVGMIEGYLRASKNITAVIPQLQDKFIEKITGVSDHNLKE